LYGINFILFNVFSHRWGDYDIKDALDGALALCDKGLADRNKLLISGGSSGGYTTLACLTFDTNKKRVFAAGTSYYGISDLAVLARDTHKFESHYCDAMIAPYPEQESVYDDRSPIKHTEDFESPCCFFQGALDKVFNFCFSLLKSFSVIPTKNSKVGTFLKWVLFFPDILYRLCRLTNQQGRQKIALLR